MNKKLNSDPIFFLFRGSHPDPVHIRPDPKSTIVVRKKGTLCCVLHKSVGPTYLYIYSYLYTNAPLPKNSTSVPLDLMKPFKTGLLKRFYNFQEKIILWQIKVFFFSFLFFAPIICSQDSFSVSGSFFLCLFRSLSIA